MPRIRADSIEAHKEQTRAEILDAAEGLFAVQGYVATSLGEIADVVGVGRTTLYEYFKNKDDLLIDLVETRVPPVLTEIVEGLPHSIPPAARLTELFSRCMAFVAEHPEFGMIVARSGRKLPTEKQDRMWGALSVVADEIARICHQGIESGEFAPGDVVLVARFVSDAFVGGMDEVLRATDPKQHLPEILDTWVPLLRRALQS